MNSYLKLAIKVISLFLIQLASYIVYQLVCLRCTKVYIVASAIY